MDRLIAFLTNFLRWLERAEGLTWVLTWVLTWSGLIVLEELAGRKAKSPDAPQFGAAKGGGRGGWSRCSPRAACGSLLPPRPPDLKGESRGSGYVCLPCLSLA